MKIDRSFVAKLTEDSRLAAITETIIRMSQQLGLDVVAEGVETPAQKEMLKKFGCYNHHEYLFSLPLPADQVPGYGSKPGRTNVTMLR